MKIQTSSLLLVTMFCLPMLHSATTAEFAGTSFQEQKKGVKHEQSPNAAVPTRSVSSKPAGSGTVADQVKFTQTAYARSSAGANTLFLAAERIGANKKENVLSRASLGVTNDGKILPMIDSLAPAKVTSNGTADQDNPLYAGTDVKITNLALMGANPVVTAQWTDGATPPVPTLAIDVFLIQDTIKGAVQLTSNGAIQDAGGTAINHSIAGLTASNRDIFAAVPANGVAFDENTINERGISVLRVASSNDSLVPVEGMSGAANTNATKLDVTAYDISTDAGKVQFAFFENAHGANKIKHAKLGSKVVLHWDESLRRLFIGLEARRDAYNDATNHTGGILNLVVARFEKNASGNETDKLVITPFVAGPNNTLFPMNEVTRIVGFYSDAIVNDHVLAIDKIRTMHTTTGKDYLIVAGHNENHPTDNRKGIYALPILRESAVDDGQIGRLAKADFSAPADAIGDMPKNHDANPQDPMLLRTRVGGALLDPVAEVTDLFVVGDSVYVCLVGDISKNAGIFQSNAIFNARGEIVGWTPFTRVMGSVERVYGAGLDPRTGSYLFLAETNEASPKKPLFPTAPTTTAPSTKGHDNISSVRQSTWGKTDLVNNLSELLKPLFPQSVGGIFQMFTFDERTPGFSQTNPAGHLNVMVAVGFERVALIQTGKNDITGTLGLVSETTFALGTNVFFRNDQGLKEIGPICTADFSRETVANQGWVFVGGYDGVAVLRQAAGTGFISGAGAGLQNLSGAGFPGGAYSFKKLVPSNNGDLSDVRKVACLGGKLYVLTQKHLYEIDMAANKFDDAGTAVLNEQNFFGIPGVALLDFIPIKVTATATDFRALLATTHGLFFLSRVSGTLVASEVKVGGKSLGPVIQLQYLSMTKGTLSEEGNLFVLAADIAGSPSTGRVYRFHVSLAGVTPIPPNNGLVADLGTFRGNFFADGSTVLHTRGKHFGLTDYLNAQPTTSSTPVPLSGLLDVSEPNSSIGSVVRDSASGALYVPTDWGLRAHL